MAKEGSEKPLLKSWEKSKPPLGWPRVTDSLCPKCVIEARRKILNEEIDYHRQERRNWFTSADRVARIPGPAAKCKRYSLTGPKPF